MTICSVDGCARDVFENDNKCILHCKKGDYPEEWSSKLKSFYDELIEEIADKAFEIEEEKGDVNRKNLIGYLKAKHNLRAASDFSKDINEFTKETIIVLHKIAFPAWDSRDNFNYTTLFRQFEAIHFDNCTFNSVGIGDVKKLNGAKFFFQECQFYKNWHIENLPMLENVNNVVYQQCRFDKGAYAYSDEAVIDPKNKIESQLFNNCNFLEELSFYRMEINAPIFSNTDDEHTKIEMLSFQGCTINANAKVILNNCSIDSFKAEDTVFNSKFEFKENEVKKFEVTNSNFFEIVDAYKTKFGKFVVFKSIFKDFTGFERCEFGEEHNDSKELMPIFMFATFLSFVTFRSAKFYGGLDMEHINLKEAPNFLNAKINPINSNRETFRIIKNSFDKVGNHIEANKFFVFEMQKYEDELKCTNKRQERIILFLNKWISEFGQNYMRPIFLMAVVAAVYYSLECGYEHNTLYKIYTPANELIQSVSDMVNGVARAILPISKFLKEGMEFVSLIFYIIYASLIWQTVVAVKRHTRR